MAQLSYPSPDHNSRNVTDAEYEKIQIAYSDDGIDSDPLQSPVVTAGSGLQVLVKAGKTGSLRGFFWESGTTDVPLSIAANSSGSTRYDRVVLRLDRSTWNVRAVVKQGTPGSGAPALTQDLGTTGVFEIVLAQVTILNGASTVSVIAHTQYLGSTVRPANDGLAPGGAKLGQLEYRPNTGELRMHTGDSNYVTVYGDSGELNITGGFSTWTRPYANVGRRIGALVWLRIWVRRSGSTFSANDPDGSHIGTLPAALRPAQNNFFNVKFSNVAGDARMEIRPDGEIWVRDNDKDIASGRDLTITVTYMVP